MGLPWYPPELPRPLRDGLQHSMGDARTFVRNDAGIELPRSRFSAVADPVSFVTTLTRAERGSLEYFVKYTVKRGDLPFLMPDPETHGWPALLPDGSPMLLPNGSPALMCATWQCLFMVLPAWVPDGVDFRVSFQLAVLP